MKIRFLAILFGVIAIATWPHSAAAQAKLERATLSVGLIPSAEFLPQFVAQDQGYFKAEGLTVTAPTFQAGTDIVQALIGNALDIAAGGGTDAMIGINANRPIKVIWELNTFVTFSVLAKPGLKSWPDMKGKTIGISAPGTQTDLVLRWLLKKNGLNPDTDVKIAPTGAPLSRMATLKSGVVDASVLTEPQGTQAEALGFGPIVRLREIQPEWPSEVFFCTEDFIKKNPETIKAFLRGIHKAAAWIPAHEKESIAIMVRDMKFAEPDAINAYKLMKGSYPVNGEFLIPGWDFAQELMLSSGDLKQKIPYEKIFDDRFVTWAKAELK